MSQERTAGQHVGEAWTKIKVLRDEIDRLTAENAEKDAQIERMRAEVQRLEAKLWDLTATIQDREKHIEWMTACAGSYEKRIDRLTAKVQERDVQLKALREHNEWLESNYKTQIVSRDMEIAEADAWAEYWRREAFRQHPTQEAYDAACAALEKHRARADAAEKEVDRLEAKEARLIHEARGASEDALKEAEENAELREKIERQNSQLIDREAEIIRQRERIDKLVVDLHKQNCRNEDQNKEIKRLQTGLEEAVEGLSMIGQISGSFVTEQLVKQVMSSVEQSLKGAE